MFSDKDLTTILFPVIGAWGIIRLIEWYVSRNKPPMKKALNSFTAGLIMMGILTGALYLSMPSTFGLESYGYPKEFKSLEEIHKYLQEHNRILARLRDIIHWFLFFFAIGFLQMLHSFAKAVAGINGSKAHSNN
jgi:hypothetical protein